MEVEPEGEGGCSVSEEMDKAAEFAVGLGLDYRGAVLLFSAALRPVLKRNRDEMEAAARSEAMTGRKVHPALRVACPSCSQPIGEQCINVSCLPNIRYKGPHPGRRAKAKEQGVRMGSGSPVWFETQRQRENRLTRERMAKSGRTA